VAGVTRLRTSCPGLSLLQHHANATTEVTGWLRRKRLDERAFLLRHLEISTQRSRYGSEPTVPGPRTGRKSYYDTLAALGQELTT
jgi:hypothetical protein